MGARTFVAGLAAAVLAQGAVHAAVHLDPQWRLVGPFRGGWGEMVVGIPERPNSFMFGAAGGGAWRSDDAGRTWTSMFDKGPTAPIGAIAIAPSNPDVVYIGSGQPEPRYDVQSGEGVFASRDGGRTWRDLGLKDTRHIGKVWIDPANPDTLLVAAVGDFFKAGPDRGVYRSTDGGATWAHTLKVDDETGAVDIAADPGDPKVVFASTWQARQYPWQSYFTPIAGPGSAVWRSADGGATWTRLGGEGWPPGPLGRISLATTRKNGVLWLYAVVSAKDASGLYRSDDDGGHWTRVNAEQAFTNYYASRITVDPRDPDVVWLVGQSVRRCSDGGRTCDIVRGAPGGDDYHFVWINPLHPDHIATASDQGVVVSVDDGKTYSSWYNQPTAQFYHLATDDRFPYRIYAGQQDSGTVRIASRADDGAIGERDWRPVGGEERDYDIPDPSNPDIVYSSGLGGTITRWDARTHQGANVTAFPLPNYGRRQTATEHRFVWVTPIALTKTLPTTLYLGAEVVFASTDGGSSWKTISPDLTGKVAGAAGCGGDPALADAKACGYGGIWSLTPSSRHAGELWVGTDSGLVQLTRDNGATWTNVTPPAIPAWAKVATIDVSPLEDGVAYIAVDNQRQGDLAPHAYATRDYGKTWRSIAGDLPAGHFVSVVRADTERPGLIFAGTDVGAFASLDDGAHWRSIQGGLPTAWVRDLAIKGDDLIAGTQGRSIWIMGDLALLRQSDVATGPIHLFRPADTVRVRANTNSDTPIAPEEPVGQNPPDGAVIDYLLAEPAHGPVIIEIRDAAGALVQTLSSAPAREPPAERYFAKAWLRPTPPLATSPGLHHALWNLHWTRPPVLSADYSISTAYGRGVTLSPQGPFAMPGVYTVILKVDGRSETTRLNLTPDPRAPIDAAALRASLDLSRVIADSLAAARRGYGEMAVTHSAALALGTPADPALAAAVADLVKHTAPPAEDGFLPSAGILAAIETALEGTDLAPTGPQRSVVAATSHHIAELSAAWAATRGGELARVNAALVHDHRLPITVPADDDLVISLPDGGEDLP
jgi:photosystem II stability/assembly factor-like uncharacterized protein